jgi:hypothetical protein
MVYQINMYNLWVPFCTTSQDIAEISPIEKLCYLSFKLPFLTERYAYFYALGIDKIEANGTIVIYGEGISQSPQMLAKYNVVPDKKKIEKLVVMDIKFFICEISYKSSTEFVLKSYCEMDSHMPILPEWLLNTVLNQMGGFIFEKVLKQAAKFEGSAFEKQMKKDQNSNPFYRWLHQRVETWHELNKAKL